MSGTLLYDGLGRKEIEDVLGCFGAFIKRYEQGETIALFPSRDIAERTVGIILSGNAALTHFDSDGEMYYSQSYEGEGVFGATFLSETADDYYVIEAKTRCEVAYTDFERISEFCENCCATHVRFTRNLYRLIAAQSKKDTRRLSVLAKKTLREKLLTYFLACANDAGSNEFNINITLTELSKYLCVDRSAMMRELGRLRAEGVLMSKGSHIKLKNVYSRGEPN
ncbi:MAG: Crp/Fnr family transcriptional regulator [Clostridia bacterium]|nr:Crp/Fnr family transcriptional regulator [Clostridia bacterium]